MHFNLSLSLSLLSLLSLDLYAYAYTRYAERNYGYSLSVQLMAETYYHKSKRVWVKLGSHSIGSGTEKGTANSFGKPQHSTHYDENPARRKIYRRSALRRMIWLLCSWLLTKLNISSHASCFGKTWQQAHGI